MKIADDVSASDTNQRYFTVLGVIDFISSAARSASHSRHAASSISARGVSPALLRFFLESVKDVNATHKSHRINCPERIATIVRDHFYNSVASESSQCLGISVLTIANVVLNHFRKTFQIPQA